MAESRCPWHCWRPIGLWELGLLQFPQLHSAVRPGMTMFRAGVVSLRVHSVMPLAFPCVPPS